MPQRHAPRTFAGYMAKARTAPSASKQAPTPVAAPLAQTGQADMAYLILMLALTASYLPQTMDPVLLPRQVTLGIGAVIIALLYGDKKARWEITWLHAALGGWVAWMGLTLLWAQNGAEAWATWSRWLGLAGYFGVTAHLLATGKLTLSGLARAISAAVCCWLAVALLQGIQALLGPEAARKVEAIKGLSANKNLLASALYLALPFVWMLPRKAWRYGLAAATLAIIALVQTRAVWLGMGIAGIMLAWQWARRGTLSKTQRVVLVTAILAAILAVSAAAYLGIADRLTRSESIQERLTLWRKSLQMIAQYPLGVGAGNWQIYLNKYGMQDFFFERVKLGQTTFQRPHSDFLWVLAEQGWVGLVLYGAVLGVGMFWAKPHPHPPTPPLPLHAERERGEQNARFASFGLQASTGSISSASQMRVAPPSPSPHGEGEGGWGGEGEVLPTLLGYLAIAATDFPLERVEHQVLLLTLLALVAVRLPVHWRVPYMPLVVTVLALASAFVGWRRIQSDIHQRRCLKAMAAARPDRVVRESRQARSAFYSVDATTQPVAFFEGSVMLAGNRLVEALAADREALAAHPWHLFTLNDLGAIHERLGAHDSARIYYHRAMAIAPDWAEPHMGLALTYYNAQLPDSAYARAVRWPWASRTAPMGKTYLRAITVAKLTAMSAREPDSARRAHILAVRAQPELYLSLHYWVVKSGRPIETEIYRPEMYLRSIEPGPAGAKATGYR